MNSIQILYKIKQTGRSTIKERKFLRKEILEVIDFSDEFIEEMSTTLIIKYHDTPIAGIYFSSKNNSWIKHFGNFADLIQEDPTFLEELTILLCGLYEKHIDNNSKPSSLDEKMKILSAKQKQNGYGFEFGLIQGLYNELNNLNIVAKIEENQSYFVLKTNFETLGESEQKDFMDAGLVAAKNLIKLEPERYTPSLNNTVVLYAQKDSEGVCGDVRDIISKENINNEIGYSCKNNNESTKHSRISNKSDFSKDWLNNELGNDPEYLFNIKNIFAQLAPQLGLVWKEVYSNEEKATRFYQPILEYFKKEFIRIIKTNDQAAGIFIQYAVGKYDYYKVIKNDKNRELIIRAFNLSGTLNKNLITKTELPTKIISSVLIKKNTLIFEFDNNWTVSLRIHSASSKIQNSFKFDIKLLKTPKIFTLTTKF